MGKKHSKPTGLIGAVAIHGDGRAPEFRTIPFPPGKAATEAMFVNAAILPQSPLGQFYGIISPPVQNEESDFDFDLHTAAGKERLDLMEIAPLEKVRGSYSSAPLTYVQGELADAIITGTTKKSRRYGGTRARGIHLLLYSTDFRFRVGNDVLWLVAKWASGTPHAFKSIVYLTFEDERTLDGKIVFPQPGRDFSHVDEASVRGRRILLADLRRLGSSPDGSSVVLPLGPRSDETD